MGGFYGIKLVVCNSEQIKHHIMLSFLLNAAFKNIRYEKGGILYRIPPPLDQRFTSLDSNQSSALVSGALSYYATKP